MEILNIILIIVSIIITGLIIYALIKYFKINIEISTKKEEYSSGEFITGNINLTHKKKLDIENIKINLIAKNKDKILFEFKETVKENITLEKNNPKPITFEIPVPHAKQILENQNEYDDFSIKQLNETNKNKDEITWKIKATIKTTNNTNSQEKDIKIYLSNDNLF